MKAILVSCPNCGARLNVIGDASEVRCEYCGTSARVQRRTRVFERVLPPPATGPTPIAVQRAGSVVKWIILAGFIAPFVIGGYIAWSVTRRVTRAAEQALQITEHTVVQTTTSSSTTITTSRQPDDGREWQGTGSAIFVDVNHDGMIDIVGRSRRVRAGDVVRVIALDGATGTPLWESEPLGSYSDTYSRPLALAGDELVFASQRGEVRSFDLATGTSRWTTKLDERTERFCDGGADTLIAVGADDVERPLARADGAPAGGTAEQPAHAVKPGHRKQPSCASLPTDEARASWDDDTRELARAHDVSSERLVRGPGGRVLSGVRATGTHVATLVALDDKDAARWKIHVAKDPLAAPEAQPEVVAVGEHEVCAAHFAASGKPPQLSCFELADGKRRWDIDLDARSPRALVIVGDSILASSVGRVQLLRLDTGAQRWRF